MKNAIAIITARGGSKRIPKKNIKEFFGKPMLAYAIDACKKSGVFLEIMVSTDSDEIADVARKFGANVPFMRSAATASDFATTYDVLEEVIARYRHEGRQFDVVCCVYPCVPFLRSYTLNRAFEALAGSDVDGVQPVCKYPAPIEWAMNLENGYLMPNDRKALSIRSQDLVPKYYDVGMFYFVKTQTMLAQRTVVPERTIGIVMDEGETQDIDTIDDWEIAERKFEFWEAK